MKLFIHDMGYAGAIMTIAENANDAFDNFIKEYDPNDDYSISKIYLLKYKDKILSELKLKNHEIKDGLVFHTEGE